MSEPAERALAARFFKLVWDLLGQSRRSAEEDLRMIHLAHASRALWQEAGGPEQWAIGEWQIARVYAVLGRAEPAIVHAQEAFRLAGDGALGRFLEVSTREGLARALWLSGETAAARQMALSARRLLAGIVDDDDHSVAESDLDDLDQIMSKG
jgi:hypothetical protein